MKASIVITTRNRAGSLERTLRAIRPLTVPDGLQAELLVIDNASTDHTAELVRSSRLDQIELRYVCETTPGKCHGCNRALAELRGELILFIDDDVHPPQNWITEMCATLLQHGPCGVAGGVRLAPELLRPWMTPLHRSWLAATEWLDPQRPSGMVGANMAFSRAVLRRVPGFDTELGPGALGFGDEQLFALQLIEAGFPIVGRLDVCVEHHFNPVRLERHSWLNAATRRGHAHAYRGHHWEHWSGRLMRPRLIRALAALAAWRLRHPQRPAEGCPAEEMLLVFRCAMLRGHLRERLRPRNYTRHGLVKLHREPVALAA